MPASAIRAILLSYSVVILESLQAVFANSKAEFQINSRTRRFGKRPGEVRGPAGFQPASPSDPFWDMIIGIIMRKTKKTPNPEKLEESSESARSLNACLSDGG